MMQTLRREFDLDREAGNVRDQIERAAWVYVHGGMNAREWVALRKSFAVLTGKVALAGGVATANPMSLSMNDDNHGW
jgi:hypothetical protein